MDKGKLNKILEDHKLWLNDEGGAQADLRRADLREADLRRADLREADLREADLRQADLRWADFSEADLRRADLREADFREADLREADLRQADLRWADFSEADLREADLRQVDLDFSSGVPFHCGGTKIKVDDRTAAQLVFHLTRQDFSSCSGGVQEAIEHIRRMAITDLFCEYRDDVKELDV